MENENNENQRNAQPTRAQRLNRTCNRMILVLGAGIVVLMVYQYVIQPLLS